MRDKLLGVHHVTAIAGDPQRNLDFYTGVLGLRLVKKTVNFDDPGTYHLYFGDDAGRPGTILTFFPWPHARRGSRGFGQATGTAFAVPEDSLGCWVNRLRNNGVLAESPKSRADEEVVTFLDPDGLKLELVADGRPGAREPAGRGAIPEELAIRGFHSVTLSERNADRTARFLTSTLGLEPVTETRQRRRFAFPGNGPGRWIDVVSRPDASHGRIGAGTVHHVAWRVGSAERQLAWRAALLAEGVDVSPVMDRQYFRSIYFREPGGVLFEIATDRPGFSLDERPEKLGTELKLPPWLEERRSSIEGVLPRLRMPE